MKQDKMNDSKNTPNKTGSKKGGSVGGESRGGQRGALAARDEKKNTCCVRGGRGGDVGPSIVCRPTQNGDGRHLNNTRSMVERAKPHTGPKPLLP